MNVLRDQRVDRDFARVVYAHQLVLSMSPTHDNGVVRNLHVVAIWTPRFDRLANLRVIQSFYSCLLGESRAATDHLKRLGGRE